MKVLVIGSGGREHAIAWQCAKFSEVHHVFVAPGNAGSALENKVTNIEIDSKDIPALIGFAKKEFIDMKQESMYNELAKYTDLLYNEKNYKKESNFILQRINR